MELMGRDVNRRLREIIYGSEFNEVDIFANSDLFMPTHTPEASAKLAHILFSTPTSQLNRKIQNIKDSTCAVIKPHAVQNGNLVYFGD